MNRIPDATSRVNSQSQTPPNKFSITVRIEPDGREKRLHGRAAWMLKQLINAGKRGVTTLDLPTGVRVSHYIFLLRRSGFIISSPREHHGGAFPSTHSRYTLATPVTIIEDMATAA
ncbi:hypothetical protein EOA75_23795 [Mesorhizobium sp. M1A.F.Ca.IN.022.07.1.1]|uniref:winged helix domain-containing protein n=1 Tax=unclassified Mesorhizobium TaxID=325217 RepID=UPI000F74EAB3|nr:MULTISPECIES: hypothetical protein [unclassified Mesorhizobium]AZO62979.1 hypothetical protein EJ078_29945 [Mesorhizobium sp. M1A.F.Ca.IN.022.06.1.1]RUV89129.1 hypothetical protein EOA75_23795 [Mesorhizobium sp. M1A.F.Ca.IN.022.07.1.1]RWH32457.1 MAG: hypothetical protein EOQ76_03005 [Mesorhizobium sp.]RWH41171.1 MAG: hypothetical protein EOQ79_02035 [Mesorhizobium sp.]TIM64415.1 MAG: hypothetical protein E5Y52_19835 [Mesorhizobium sp.]